MGSCHLHYHALWISKVGKLTSITNNALVHTRSPCANKIYLRKHYKKNLRAGYTQTSHLFIWFTFIHFYFISIVPNLLRKMSRKPAVIKIFIKKKKIIALRTWLTSMLVYMHRYEYFNFYKKNPLLLVANVFEITCVRAYNNVEWPHTYSIHLQSWS